MPDLIHEKDYEDMSDALELLQKIGGDPDLCFIAWLGYTNEDDYSPYGLVGRVYRGLDYTPAAADCVQVTVTPGSNGTEPLICITYSDSRLTLELSNHDDIWRLYIRLDASQVQAGNPLYEAMTQALHRRNKWTHKDTAYPTPTWYKRPAHVPDMLRFLEGAYGYQVRAHDRQMLLFHPTLPVLMYDGSAFNQVLPHSYKRLTYVELCRYLLTLTRTPDAGQAAGRVKYTS